MPKRGRFINVEPTPDNFRALWSMLHSHDDTIQSQATTIASQTGLIASLQSALSAAEKSIREHRTLLALSQQATPLTPSGLPTSDGGTGGSGGGGGGGGGTTDPSCGGPWTSEVPDWFATLLTNFGATNCASEALLPLMEPTLNGMSYYVQKDSGCNYRLRLFYDPVGPIITFCGQPMASDFSKFVDLLRSDGGWTWRQSGF